MNQRPRPIGEIKSIQTARNEALELAVPAHPERSQRVTPHLSEAAVRGSAEVVDNVAEPAKLSLEKRRRLEELTREYLQRVEAIGDRIVAYRAGYNAVAARTLSASDVMPKDQKDHRKAIN